MLGAAGVLTQLFVLVFTLYINRIGIHLFKGSVEGFGNVAIKFTENYSEEVHRFLAVQGHAFVFHHCYGRDRCRTY